MRYLGLLLNKTNRLNAKVDSFEYFCISLHCDYEDFNFQTVCSLMHSVGYILLTKESF